MVYGPTQLMSRPSDLDESMMIMALDRDRLSPASTSHHDVKMSPASVSKNIPTKKLTKQPVKPRRKWKKPKDKPKRPLSAYNLYFKDERERIINGKEPDCSSSLGFRAMAQFVATKWNSLNAQERSKYEKQAMKEKGKYFTALAQWKKQKREQEKDAKPQDKQDSAKTEPQQKKKTTKSSKANKSSAEKPKRRAPAKTVKANKRSSSTTAAKVNSGKNVHDNDEPLPIEYPLDMSGDLSSIFSPGGGNSFAGGNDVHTNSMKSSASLIDALQETLGCFSSSDTSSTLRQRLDLSSADHCEQGRQEQHYRQACTSVTKRVWTSLDSLRADKDFVGFMGALDWK